MSADTDRLIAQAREEIAKADRGEGSEPWAVRALLSALEAAEAQRDTLAKALGEVVYQFNMWSEDANDGTYAYYKSDGLMAACVAARAALAGVAPPEAET